MKSKITDFLLAVLCCVLFWVVLMFCYSCNSEPTTHTPKDVGVVYEEKGEDQAFDRDEIVVELICVEPEEVEKETIKDLGEFVLTAYCSCEKCCGKWALNRPKDENGNDIIYGASGERLYQGVSVAVDPEVIPYGSTIYIDGQEYIAHDCGGAIKGKRIDVYFEEHEAALEFGKKTKNVEVELSESKIADEQ